jgi:RNase H-fold protein (predicted Holliday junction resolvase)
MNYLSLKEFSRHVLSRKNQRFPLAGLDVGKRLVGLAVSDTDKQMAFPLLTINRKVPRMSPDALSSFGKRLNFELRDRDVCGLVIGLPIGRDDGELTPLALEIIKIFEKISDMDFERPHRLKTGKEGPDDASEPDLAFTFWDERYSTYEARRILTQKSYQRNKDRAAAALILQGFQQHVCGAP